MTQPNSFNDFTAALRMKEIIARVVREEMDRRRPPVRFGKVHDFNRFTHSCDILFPGDVEITRVKAPPHLQPLRRAVVDGIDFADVVRVEGTPGNLWITGIVNSAGFSDGHVLHLPSLRGGLYMHQQVAKFFGGWSGDLPPEGQAWYVGKWTNPNSLGGDGLAMLYVVVRHVFFASQIKKYELAIRSNDTQDQWKKCAPTADSGPWSQNDFDLEIKTGNDSVELRVRRTTWNSGGFTPGGYTVDAWFYGEDWDRDYSAVATVSSDPEPTRFIGTASVEARGPFLSPAMDISRRAQQLLVGGGAMTFSTAFGDIFKWTAKFITSGIGRNYLARHGYFDIGVPAGGVTVPVYNKSGVTSTSTVAGGVYLGDWDALYYEPPWGDVSTFDETKFRIVNYSNSNPNTDFQVPSHWIFVAMKSGDSAFPYVKVGTGEFIDMPRNLSLDAGWAALGFPWATPAYRAIQGNRVELEGIVKATAVKAADQTIATLPTHWRPLTPRMFPATKNGAFASIVLTETGIIRCSPAMAVNDWISLDGISFPRAQ